MSGIICPGCGEEVFQLIPRKVEVIPGMTIEIKFCPLCIKKIDAAKEKESEEKIMEGMTKAERRETFQEKARQWARSLHGKKVIIFWDLGVNQVFSDPASEYHARGVAYDASGKWGKITVVLDKEENKRVKKTCHGVSYCDTVKKDLFLVSDHFVCDQADCKEQLPVMDGLRFSRYVLPTGDDNWYIPINWGERNSIVLEEDWKGK